MLTAVPASTAAPASSGKAPIGLPLLPLLREDRRQSRISEEEAMALRVRRGVARHDAAGKGVVSIDGKSQKTRFGPPGGGGCGLLASGSVPVCKNAPAEWGP